MAEITLKQSTNDVIFIYFTHKNLLIIATMKKKLSYRRETARQLPTWGRLGPPAHLATPMHMVESETRNKRTSSVPSIKRTLR